MDNHSPARTRALLAYSAWKSLMLAHGFLVSARVSVSVISAIDAVEKELAISLDLLPPELADEVAAHFNRRKHDWRLGYGN